MQIIAVWHLGLCITGASVLLPFLSTGFGNTADNTRIGSVPVLYASLQTAGVSLLLIILFYVCAQAFQFADKVLIAPFHLIDILYF